MFTYSVVLPDTCVFWDCLRIRSASPVSWSCCPAPSPLHFAWRILFTCCIDRIRSLCSSSRPWSFSLLASCCAFFFSLQARLANLFFSFLDFVLVGKGTSLTGVKALISLFNLSSSFPMAASFFGFAVRSFPSPLRAFPLQTFEYVNSCTSLYWSTYVSKFLYPARMLHYCVQETHVLPSFFPNFYIQHAFCNSFKCVIWQIVKNIAVKTVMYRAAATART